MIHIFPTDPSPQSPLMVEALKAHGLSVSDVPEESRHLANARCLTCENADACFAWLTGARSASDYHWFCPNAQLFDGLVKDRAQ